MEGADVVSVHGESGKDFLKLNMSRHILAGTLTLLLSEPNIKAIAQCNANLMEAVGVWGPFETCTER